MTIDFSLAHQPSCDTSPHSKILGVFFLLFGVAHASVIGFVLAMFLFLLLMPFGNPAEDQFNLALVIILSIAILFVGVLPTIAGYGLVAMRRWGKNALAISSATTLLFVGSVTYLVVWHAKQYPLLLYVLPCLMLMIYSGWYVWCRKPAG